jgi:hypothetical protein
MMMMIKIKNQSQRPKMTKWQNLCVFDSEVLVEKCLYYYLKVGVEIQYATLDVFLSSSKIHSTYVHNIYIYIYIYICIVRYR